MRELQSIVDYGGFVPSVDPVFNAISSWYWSSTSNANNPDNAWNVNFNDGNVNDAALDNHNHVRAVRPGT